MSSLDDYLSRLERKHVGETRKQKNKRRSKELVVKSAIVAKKELTKAEQAVAKRNTPENRRKFYQKSKSFGKWLQRTYNL